MIYDIRARPYQIKSDTGTKDLQMVDLGLRILYRPNASQIPWLAKNIGLSMSNENGKNHNISLDYDIYSDEKDHDDIDRDDHENALPGCHQDSLFGLGPQVPCSPVW